MVWIIFTIGSFIVVFCLAALIRPKIIRSVLTFSSVGNRLYRIGFMRTIIGIMLLILAPRARLWWYVTIFGLICTASGLSVFFFALKRTKKILSRIRRQSDFILRVCALIGLIIWLILFYALLELVPTLAPR